MVVQVICGTIPHPFFIAQPHLFSLYSTCLNNKIHPGFLLLLLLSETENASVCSALLSSSAQWSSPSFTFSPVKTQLNPPLHYLWLLHVQYIIQGYFIFLCLVIHSTIHQLNCLINPIKLHHVHFYLYSIPHSPLSSPTPLLTSILTHTSHLEFDFKSLDPSGSRPVMDTIHFISYSQFSS